MNIARRGGHTLVELMAVMAVASAVVGVAVTTLHLILEAEGAARRRLENRTAVSHLARQFRSDAHAADALQRADDASADVGPEWEFRLGPDHLARYQLQDEEILRTETAGGEIRRREIFLLPEGTLAALEPPSSDDAPIASLRLFPREPEARQGRTLRIDAWLGMNARFSSPDNLQESP